MRRLPVFLLLDVSESMAGGAHDAVTGAVASMVAQLRTDPEALEKLHLSIIVFAGKPKTIVPLTELAVFYPPEIPLGSGTALGAGLSHLMNEMEASVAKPTASQRGDWKPVVFLLTDGASTDDTAAAIARWHRDFASRAQMIAVSVGPAADASTLKTLTDDVVRLHSADPATLTRFVAWISQSVKTHSQTIGDPGAGDGISLKKDLPSGAEIVLDKSGFRVDERVATFVGRCQQTERPYLVRFERGVDRPDVPYQLREVTALKESFFELSSDRGVLAGTLNTSQIAGMPGCPHCGTHIGLVWCGMCGEVHCLQGPGTAICPWCGAEGNYAPAAKGSHWDVGRSAG